MPANKTVSWVSFLLLYRSNIRQLSIENLNFFQVPDYLQFILQWLPISRAKSFNAARKAHPKITRVSHFRFQCCLWYSFSVVFPLLVGGKKKKNCAFTSGTLLLSSSCGIISSIDVPRVMQPEKKTEEDGDRPCRHCPIAENWRQICEVAFWSS